MLRKNAPVYANKIRYIIIACIISVVIILAFGIPTALIPTGLFARMISVTILDYVFLFLTSALLGSYISLHLYQKRVSGNACDYAAAGGGISSVFAFGCPVCNVFLVSLLGASFIFVYFDPLRPVFGVVGVAAISWALYMKIRKKKSIS